MFRCYDSPSDFCNIIATRIITISNALHQLNLWLKFHKTLAFLIAFFVFMTAYNPVASADPINQPVKIMPLGNSITFDPFGETGYRSFLWHMLIDYGHNIDFVGSVVSGQNTLPLFDPDNEGHPGWTAAQIEADVYTFLQDNPADIVLLHIGTNGLGTDTNDVEAILDDIDLYEADTGRSVVVILALIINRSCITDIPACPESTTISVFNDALAAMAQNRITDGDNIIVVDMENSAGLDYHLAPTGDMFDNWHLADSGYAKMADVWFNALQSVLPAPEELPYVEITSPTNGSTVEVPFDIEFTYDHWTLSPGGEHIRLLIDGQDQGG
jgi:hypothetical protein